ncbi:MULTISPECIES: DUF2288 domain-containing protein [Ectothiorhodospira]|uniref:DUF2288 domain-containing protein n=1 Tax=Ectothiorhodospira TaxID=1051 RepID=UPI000A06A1E3|nr:DUF2288 domain-containing protein [Ectothiorhodospira haloalkaliphila]MCG5494976.1 DUF2288 domain-containing protein [Ectothiorhodospira variabilis]MCG5496319.1 DUF2288 domain-containing protein [Ectothiorhodospira variabilis]MCG5504489.1 DUF2288 domain-containing protein [Ectothiorhodospira variabilis]MCG5507645.1 DUF2288 domain-containing protein [Ectothiorhodospira variabilis]MCG5523822.1 DUF2288 domain-containing protein [Ectothiorhodospira haloalkaliphila]
MSQPTQPQTVQARTPQEIRQLLEPEKGPITWPELQPHFARGVVLHVAEELPLLDAAIHLVQDDKLRVQDLLTQGLLARADVDHAKDWEARKPRFEAVVVAPWVLVREI